MSAPKATEIQGIPLSHIFGSGGILENRFQNYEYRPSQLAMAEAVLKAIREGRHLCVEAGTGTGKTLAYLIPALYCRKRVVVSTATRNLQDQLFFKDIPFIRQHLFPELAVTYMKGRQNYLCLRKHQELAPQEGILQEAQEDWRRISEWLPETETGDRSELEWLGDNDVYWRHLDARGETCTGQKCSYFDQCYVTRMRQRAFASDLIVVNHAFLFAHLAIETDEIGRVLPDFATLILDEAHETEDIAANHFGRQISSYQVEDFSRDFRKVFEPERGTKNYDDLLDQMERAQGRLLSFFDSFPAGEERYSLNFYRHSDGSVTDLRGAYLATFQESHSALTGLFHHLQRLSRKPTDADPLIRRLEQMIGTLEHLFNLEDSESIFWCERRRRGVFLHANPIDVATILREKLFSRVETAILTSATLTTEGNFEYFKGRLGAPEPAELVVPGEFNYSEQAILYVPSSFPEPRSPYYLPRALDVIRLILEITQGHAFLLFTSFAQMDRAYEALQDELRFPLLRQGEMPKNRLLELFKTTPQAVLCATSSFWQGVDVQGDALRAVVIDKLPFKVPTEPLVAARINRLEAQGENSFLRYSVPEAIITLKQGLGRLIRSRQDRGILAVLDSRLRSRSYGQLFFRSFPECPVTDKIDDLEKFFKK